MMELTVIVILATVLATQKAHGRGTITLSSKQTDGIWGNWGKAIFCPANVFVIGYRLRSEGPQGSGDDTALNDIQLLCASKSRRSYRIISSRGGNWGSWSSWKICPGFGNPVVAFNMLIEGPQGRGDDTAANKVVLYCKSTHHMSASTSTSWGRWTRNLSCPHGMAVMGLSTRVESPQGSGDDTALNGVRLFCQKY